MIGELHGNADDKATTPSLRGLTALAILSASMYAAISFLSWQFDFDIPVAKRPILVVLLLFAAAFIGYLFAIRLAIRASNDLRLLPLILWTSVLFRAILLPSVPIQEIDIYRYLWDGSVSTTGISPFRYSPDEVRAAIVDPTDDEQLSKLVRLCDKQPALAEILRRVHFGDLPTIYPPTSQIVFALATWSTPQSAPMLVRIFIMKTWFIGFDLATLFVVIALLKRCRMPIGLCLIYAWCPLLLKEIANSGHLDTVAVFLSTCAVYFVARTFTRDRVESRVSFGMIITSIFAAIVFALAVGAKLYPIVLAPLIFVVLAKNVGWFRMLIPMTIFAVTTWLVLCPLLRNTNISVRTRATVQTASHDPSLGVTTFLRHWEMNDFIFLLLVENLNPEIGVPPNQLAWFSVVPESVRGSVVACASFLTDVNSEEAPFLTARLIAATAFVVIAMWLAWKAARTNDISSFCEAAFLTLAWFWLLCPTQNPWYWIWALPLLPFARGRAWLAMSGLVLFYYFRFWLIAHYPDTPVLGTRYNGAAFFDFVITWVEFFPWLLWLASDAYIRVASEKNRKG